LRQTDYTLPSVSVLLSSIQPSGLCQRFRLWQHGIYPTTSKSSLFSCFVPSCTCICGPSSTFPPPLSILKFQFGLGCRFRLLRRFIYVFKLLDIIVHPYYECLKSGCAPSTTTTSSIRGPPGSVVHTALTIPPDGQLLPRFPATCSDAATSCLLDLLQRWTLFSSLLYSYFSLSCFAQKS